MKVYFFGDSICFGQHISPSKAWVTRIADRLSSSYGDSIAVQNPSISGNTTRMALERMPHDVSGHAPDILLIQFGMNDCNYWLTDAGVPRVSPAAFEANLREMIDRAEAVGTRRVLIATNHPSTRTTEAGPQGVSYQEGNARYNEIIRKVARTRLDDGALVDNEAAWKLEIDGGVRHAELLLADEIHLSAFGHDLYLSSVYPIVARCVEELL